MASFNSSCPTYYKSAVVRMYIFGY